MTRPFLLCLFIFDHQDFCLKVNNFDMPTAQPLLALGQSRGCHSSTSYCPRLLSGRCQHFMVLACLYTTHYTPSFLAQFLIGIESSRGSYMEMPIRAACANRGDHLLFKGRDR